MFFEIIYLTAAAAVLLFKIYLFSFRKKKKMEYSNSDSWHTIEKEARSSASLITDLLVGAVIFLLALLPAFISGVTVSLSTVIFAFFFMLGIKDFLEFLEIKKLEKKR